MSNRLRTAFDRAWKGAEHRSWIRGLIGRPETDGTYTVVVADRPGYVYVRVSQEGAQSLTIAKSLGKVSLRGNLPVRMRREPGSGLVIHEVDDLYYEAATAGDATNIYGVQQHTHALDSGMPYEVEAMRLAPGLVHPNGAWEVSVGAFRYYYNAAWETFAGGTLSLLANKPSTSGKHRLVVVCLDPSTNTLTAVSGSDQDYATTLDQDDIDAISIGDTFPLGAVLMRQDDSNIETQSRYIDARGWLNYSAGVTFDDSEGDPANIGTTADGTSDYAARRDHVHAITTAAVGGAIFSDGEGDPADVGTTADGTSDYAARRDHVHGLTDGSIANAKLANMSEGTIKGRASGAGSGAPQDLTAGQAAAIVGTGALDVDTSATGNVGTGEDTIASYTIPANTLASNGDSIWFEASGTTGDNSNSKQLRVKFGSDEILSATDTAWGREWTMNGRIIRVGSSSQKGYCEFQTNSGIGAGSLGGAAGINNACTEDETGTITLSITAECVSDNDFVCETFIVGYTPAP